MSYWLRILIAFDFFCEAWFRVGTLCITMSSRTFTAQAHQHKWGDLGVRFLDWAVIRWTWNGKPQSIGFGRDFVTGKSHCEQAREGDLRRLKAATDELNDPAVLAHVAKLATTRALIKKLGGY